MSLLRDYVCALRENNALGVSETSSYGALQTLLSGVGANLKPSVRCVLHPQSQGAGLPDGGLFSREQLQPLGHDYEPTQALQMTPSRGVLEVKGTSANLQTLVASQQVAKYLAKYRKVICTNYREFAVVELQNETPRVLETFSFAPDEVTSNEAAFWAATNDIAAFESEHGERFTAFLERALLYGAPLASPEAVAGFMASCAREAKLRVQSGDVPSLQRVRSSLEAALDVSFGDSRATAFFESSLVQTLFYGVFSAWVLWGRDNPPASNGQSSTRFDWRASAHYLHVPVLQSLFYEISNPQTLQSLDLVEPLNWVSDALNRVDRASFDERFSDGSAVQYFYEPFLAAFDPELRKQLGVWYTPQSVVRYMVERVHRTLIEELGLPDGLADERVVVLDPCCGTGAYLVEVIRRIHQTLQEKDDDALGATDLKSAVLNRLYGFELLTAPFVVAHLQLGLLLGSLGAPLKDSERAKIFLTNALTGWSEPDGDQIKIEMPELRAERDAADKVKQEKKILVILGNPPYDGYAGIAMREERELSQAYRSTTNPQLPRPEGQGLNELYVRFFRMAERKITQDTGEGIVCFISNYSWLDGKSHTGMREAFLSRFSQISVDSLNGDRFRTGKVAPDGTPDPSIFSMPSNREGIQVGTAIALMVRRANHSTNIEYSMRYRDLWGTAKHAQLEAETAGTAQAEYATLQPPLALGLPFMPTRTRENYTIWPLLPDLFPTSFPGVKTSRDEVVIDIDRERLLARMTAYFDANVSHEQMRALSPPAMKDTAEFQAKSTRETLQTRGFLPDNIVRYCYRPFDVRWIYWEPETKLLDRNRADYWPHVFDGNLCMEGRSRVPQLNFDRGLTTPHLGDNMGNGLSLYFPLLLRDMTTANLFDDAGDIVTKPNLSALSQTYLSQMNSDARTLFLHALAIQHAPRYREENADALRLAWPRIPLPTDNRVLEVSGTLGETVSQLLDVLKPVGGVSTGAIRDELRVVGVVSRVGGGALDTGGGELALRAGWGYRNPQGAVMPGNGRVVAREWTPAERAQIESGAALHGLDLNSALAHWGENAVDVFINDVAFWSGIPSRVWSYTLGGYRVLKKWLSYREVAVLGRDLTTAEAREFRDIARRIAALLLLESPLDTNYEACSVATWSDEEA